VLFGPGLAAVTVMASIPAPPVSMQEISGICLDIRRCGSDIKQKRTSSIYAVNGSLAKNLETVKTESHNVMNQNRSSSTVQAMR
jgi:hypothetical protein